MTTTNIIAPALWLILFLVGLPQLSETVYTPALPEITHALGTTDAMVEYTLTIYLFGLALGALVFGRISDYVGRKPALLAGLALFIVGCVGCYISSSIEMLMISRLIQAFGGSVGSVLGQAICRDAFHGPALGRAYSTIGSALALFPAVGPVVGGVLAQYLGWSNIFLALIVFASTVLLFSTTRLQETLPKEARQHTPLLPLIRTLLTDKRVVCFGLIVSVTNGILFSYFAEGPFFFMEILGLSPTMYGGTFVALAGFTALGGLVSKKLQNSHTSLQIMRYGVWMMVVFAALASLLVITHTLISWPTLVMIVGPLICQMMINFGMCMVNSNALALALVDYKHCIGTASSLFGCFYYIVISLFTFGMGTLHNDTLLPMPLYFLGLSCFMLWLSTRLDKR